MLLASEADGSTILFTSSPSIPGHVWARARQHDLDLVTVIRDGCHHSVLMADYMEYGVQSAESGTITLDIEPLGSPAMVCYSRDGSPPIAVDLTSYWDWRVEQESHLVKLDEPFVHLHTHSEMSPLDGLSKMGEIVDTVVGHGHPALAITDHGVCSAHPELQTLATKAGIKPIFGVEAYLVDDRLMRPRPKKAPAGISPEGMAAHMEAYSAEMAEARDYYHLILWAQNDEGLRNIWAATTEANRDGFYYKPRMDWDTLARHSEGVIASTACLRGPLAHPLLRREDEGLAMANLARLQQVFGDRLYLELHTNRVEEQRGINEWLVGVSQERSIPLTAVCDSHYCSPDDRHAHQVWIAIQTNKDLQDEPDLFAGSSDYHLMNREEVEHSLSYLPSDVVQSAIDTTVTIADLCDASIPSSASTPVYSKKGDTRGDRILSDRDRLISTCLASWSKTENKRHDQATYMARFEYEMALLIEKEFCGYFLMVEDYVAEAKRNNILVGPGRGSGGGCLVAYLCGITEIDPVEAELLFERFLNPGRDALPDFDVDFPASERDRMTNYIIERYGVEHVVRVGTHVRLKNKGIFRDLARVLGGTIDNPNLAADIQVITKAIEQAEADSAGLGYSWDKVLSVIEDDLAPYIERYPELFDLAGRLVGRLKTYGKHPAGVVISPDDPIVNRLPMWATKEGITITEFDMDALEGIGMVKFDILTIRTLDTIQQALDLIEKNHDRRIDIYNWRDEYEDPGVWKDIGDGNTLGMFQIETPACTILCRRFQPTSMNDLSDVITLVRPGPKRSGLTDLYFRRRNGEEPVAYPHPDLEEALSKTYGCMVYQEDIMRVCQIIGGYSLAEADDIRKILGKKKIEQAREAGVTFVERAVKNGYEKGLAVDLWDQMIEFSKYSFNRSHAWAYAMLAFWTAWIKHHYPVEFLTAALSTVDKLRIPSFAREAKRMGISLTPCDINLSSESFTGYPHDGRILYGFSGIAGVGGSKVAKIIESQPYQSFTDFQERSGVDSGTTRSLVRLGAFDSLHKNRGGLIQQVERAAAGDDDVCIHRGDPVQITTDKGEWMLPCSYDWAGEPVEIGKTGRPKKPKPPPKRCTKACRRYERPAAVDFQIDSIEGDLDKTMVMDTEKELLGFHLTFTPFDHISADDLASLRKASEVTEGPPGFYGVAAIVSRVGKHRDRNGNEMAFLTLDAQDGDLDVTVFASIWSDLKPMVRQGTLVIAGLRKQAGERGGLIIANDNEGNPSFYPVH